MRKLISVIALALSLALPSSALAATTSGTTSESLTLAASISMTVPASVTYAAQGGGTFLATVPITNVSTDNTTGLSIYGTFSTLTGPATIAVTNRAFLHDGGLGTIPDASTTDLNYGDITDAGQGYLFVNLNAATAPKSGSWSSLVQNVTAPGTYSGTITFTAATN